MSINYGYFRHRFDAHTDPKLQGLAEELGVAAYGYYFTLLELYGQKYSQETDVDCVELHYRTIANTWQKRKDTCRSILAKMEKRGLLVVCNTKQSDNLVTTNAKQSDNLVVTKLHDSCRLSIPNFPKYYGSYLKKAPNKSKVKESKVKESKVKESKVKESKVKESKVKESKVKEKKVKPPVSYANEKSLLEFWNEQGIIKHELSESNFEKIAKQRKKHKGKMLSDLKQMVANYKTALDGDFFNYKWPLWDFLSRKKNARFFPDEFVPENWQDTPAIDWDKIGKDNDPC